MIRSPSTPSDSRDAARARSPIRSRWGATPAPVKEAPRRPAVPNTRYRFSTGFGMFCIELRRSGLWRVLFGRKELGGFRSPESALGDLLHDETAWPGGPRNSALGLPTDLAEWVPSYKKPR